MYVFPGFKCSAVSKSLSLLCLWCSCRDFFDFFAYKSTSTVHALTQDTWTLGSTAHKQFGSYNHNQYYQYHLLPSLHQLHWLPVRQRVDFKVATLVHQSLSGISPPYLADDYRLVADARERRLRSTASRTCVVTQTYSTFGDRAFGAAGPGLWNSLLSHLKDADISYSEFRRSLKTFLFGQWGHGAV